MCSDTREKTEEQREGIRGMTGNAKNKSAGGFFSRQEIFVRRSCEVRQAPGALYNCNLLQRLHASNVFYTSSWCM